MMACSTPSPMTTMRRGARDGEPMGGEASLGAQARHSITARNPWTLGMSRQGRKDSWRSPSGACRTSVKAVGSCHASGPRSRWIDSTARGWPDHAGVAPAAIGSGIDTMRGASHWCTRIASKASTMSSGFARIGASWSHRSEWLRPDWSIAWPAVASQRSSRPHGSSGKSSSAGMRDGSKAVAKAQVAMPSDSMIQSMATAGSGPALHSRVAQSQHV